MSTPIYSWTDELKSVETPVYFRFDLYSNYLVCSVAATGTLGKVSEFQEERRLQLRDITRARWLSRNVIELEGKTADGSYVSLACSGSPQQIAGLCGELAKLRPELKIDERENASMFTNMDRVFFWAIGLLVAVAVLIKLAASFFYGKN